MTSVTYMALGAKTLDPKTLSFLRRVTPAEGIYGYAHLKRRWNSEIVGGVETHKEDKARSFMTSRPADSLEDVLREAYEADARGEDAYFALATFQEREVPDPKNPGKVQFRTKGNSRALRAFWLDLDTGPEKAAKGDGYATGAELTDALARFLQITGLPWTMDFVQSGGGAHVYWALDRDLSPEEWAPAAAGLKALCANHGLLADPSCTTDAARILRVPGTRNFKTYGRPVTVTIGQEGAVHNADALIALLAPHAGERKAPKTGVADRAQSVEDARIFGSSSAAPDDTHLVELTDPAEHARAVSALQALDPATDNATWTRILWSFKNCNVPNGKEIARAWSAQDMRPGAGYDPAAFDDAWERGDDREGGAKAGTLFSTAQEAGWTGSAAVVAPTGGEGEAIERSMPITQTFNDDGNAARLLHAAGGTVRFSVSRGKWYSWGTKTHDGTDGALRWRPDDHGHVLSWAAGVLRDIYAEARAIDDTELAKRVAAHATKSLDIHRVKAAVEMMRSIPGVSFTADEADTDKMALQARNGVHINLRDGTTRAVTMEDLMLHTTGCDYDPNATCPRWEQALLEVFEGDVEMVAFLQRLAGWFTTGLIRDHHFVFFYGHGANGKTVVLNVLYDVLGSYALQVPASMYMAIRPTAADSPTPTLAQLPGVRLAVSNEITDGSRLDEERVKALTGGDPISARGNYARHQFVFRPEAKHVMAGNYRPVITGDDHGMWRRMILVPFGRQFDGDERDADLPNKLRAEYPGILNWVIKGAQEYIRTGLRPPASIRGETDRYRSDMDVFGQWRDECTQDAPGATTQAKHLFASYADWCRLHRHGAYSSRRFADRMKTLGFTSHRTKAGMVYDNLRLV